MSWRGMRKRWVDESGECRRTGDREEDARECFGTGSQSCAAHVGVLSDISLGDMESTRGLSKGCSPPSKEAGDAEEGKG